MCGNAGEELSAVARLTRSLAAGSKAAIVQTTTVATLSQNGYGQPLAELSLSERSEDSAVNRALRARIRRKLEAVKQEATQLPRLNCLGRRESVLCTYGVCWNCVSNDQAMFDAWCAGLTPQQAGGG